MGAQNYGDAIMLFLPLRDYKDSEQHIAQCQEGIARIKAEEEANAKETEQRRAREDTLRKVRNKKIGIITGITAAIAIVILAVIAQVIIPANNWRAQYRAGEALLTDGNYFDAAIAFGKAGNYNNASARSFEKLYQ